MTYRARTYVANRGRNIWRVDFVIVRDLESIIKVRIGIIPWVLL